MSCFPQGVYCLHFCVIGPSVLHQSLNTGGGGVQLLACPTLCNPMACSTPGLLVPHISWSCPSSCPLNWWCHQTITPSVDTFSFCPQSFPASGSFLMSVLHLRYWSFSFSISPSNEYSGLISFRTDWFALLAAQGTLKSLLQYHSSKASVLQRSAFFMVHPSHVYMTTGAQLEVPSKCWAVSCWGVYCSWGLRGDGCFVNKTDHSGKSEKGRASGSRWGWICLTSFLKEVMLKGKPDWWVGVSPSSLFLCLFRLWEKLLGFVVENIRFHVSSATMVDAKKCFSSS